jgi:hypothetical protein
VRRLDLARGARLLAGPDGRPSVLARFVLVAVIAILSALAFGGLLAGLEALKALG